METNFCSAFNLFKIIKLIVKSSLIIFMSYQLYNITYDYFSYPYIVKLNVLNDNQIQLPSIIICTEKGVIWQRNSFPEIFSQINKSLKLLEQKIINNKTDVCNSFYDLGKYYYCNLNTTLFNFEYNQILNNITINSNV